MGRPFEIVFNGCFLNSVFHISEKVPENVPTSVLSRQACNLFELFFFFFGFNCPINDA